MGLELEISQKQTVSTQMVQLMNIMQLNVQELDNYINNLALENPLIDLQDIDFFQGDTKQRELLRKMDWLDSTDYRDKVYYRQDSSEEEMEQNWYDKRNDEIELSEFLISQMKNLELCPKEQSILETLILLLDSKGYFTEDLAALAKELKISETKLLKYLKILQTLDPAGVGARDLKECLFLQLERKRDSSELSKKIVKNYLEDIAKNHITDIAKKTQSSMEEVRAACDEIRALNPKPGNYFSNREMLNYIVPDVVVLKFENTFEILINEYQYSKISINSNYKTMIDFSDDETRDYLKKKISQVEWVQNCISQRNTNLLNLMNIIVEKQKNFFLYGTGHKSPLRLKDLAKELSIHESTVSRILKGKYVQCCWGVFPLNYFLTSIATRQSQNGEAEKTPDQIKELIQNIIAHEDKKHPLSDQKICDKIKQQNITISRRTIAKYRTQMGIPDKSGRKDC